MITTHTTTVHAVCPRGGWDYYYVEFQPAEFITVEQFESACDEVRGSEQFQEDLFGALEFALPKGQLTITGRHSSNSETVCTNALPE